MAGARAATCAAPLDRPARRGAGPGRRRGRWSGRDAGGAGARALGGTSSPAGARRASCASSTATRSRSAWTARPGPSACATSASTRRSRSSPARRCSASPRPRRTPTQRLVGGRRVRLEGDVEPRDRYGRLLAYVYAGAGPDPRRSSTPRSCATATPRRSRSRPTSATPRCSAELAAAGPARGAGPVGERAAGSSMTVGVAQRLRQSPGLLRGGVRRAGGGGAAAGARSSAAAPCSAPRRATASASTSAGRCASACSCSSSSAPPSS